jgi:hypothetical protein
VSEKVTNHFKMLRAVVDDAETAALAAASEHLHQLDKLRLEASTLSRENADLALEVMQTRHQLANAGPADVVHLKEANGCLMAETMRLGAMLERAQTERGELAEKLAAAASPTSAIELFKSTQRLRSERDEARAELAHMRDQLGFALATIEKATTEAAERVVYANVDTSLEDPRVGKLLVVRIDDNDALAMRQGKGFRALTEQFVGWLKAAQDEGDTETKPVDVHHAGMPTPVVRCGECTATVGHFGDCATWKAVQP